LRGLTSEKLVEVYRNTFLWGR